MLKKLFKVFLQRKWNEKKRKEKPTKTTLVLVSSDIQLALKNFLIKRIYRFS